MSSAVIISKDKILKKSRIFRSLVYMLVISNMVLATHIAGCISMPNQQFGEMSAVEAKFKSDKVVKESYPDARLISIKAGSWAIRGEIDEFVPKGLSDSWYCTYYSYKKDLFIDVITSDEARILNAYKYRDGEGLKGEIRVYSTLGMDSPDAYALAKRYSIRDGKDNYKVVLMELITLPGGDTQQWKVVFFPPYTEGKVSAYVVTIDARTKDVIKTKEQSYLTR